MFAFPLWVNAQTAAGTSGPDYSAVDKRALAAPADAEASLEALANYLAPLRAADLEKARAIYRWIADRIAYDTVSFRKRVFRSQKPEDVFRERKTVCGGYARLYEHLAKLGGLECVFVSGYSKGYGYKPGESVTNSTHAWNAVRIGSRWQLLDVTWGAGYTDDNYKFVKTFDEDWFLAQPQEMIITHFPEEVKWQLLPTAVSMTEFEDFVYLFPAFLRRGFKLSSHTKGVINTGADIEVTLKAKQNAIVSARLEEKKKELDRSCLLVQKRMDGQVQVKALFPRKGDYKLSLFSRTKDEKGEKMECILEYQVKASDGKGEQACFPEIFSAFSKGDCYLYQPMEKHLKSGSTQNFKIKAPDATEVGVMVNKEWKWLKRGLCFEGPVKIEKGPVRVYAKFPGDKEYTGLLEYFGD